MIEMCKHPTRSAYRQLLYKLAFAETQQCQVEAAPPGIDVLKKVNDTKWIGVTGPGGLCNVVATSTLERENKKSELWTWTDVTSTTDSSELCKKSGVTQSVNKPSVFTWKSGRFPMHCEAVDFGH